MPAKPKAPKQVKAADLHLFRALHAELDAAHQRRIAAAHKQLCVQLQQEIASMKLSAQSNAATREAQQHADECAADIAAAKAAAKDLADRLAIDYAIDLRTHAIHPLTGDIVALPEENHG